MGVITADFHALGNLPEEKDKLKRRQSGKEIEGLRAFKTSLGRPSGPGALRTSNLSEQHEPLLW